MAEAAELLEIMALSIGENGIRVGCANSLHFSRDFKKEYSAAPIIEIGRASCRERVCLYV